MNLLVSYAPSPATSKEISLKPGCTLTIGRDKKCNLHLADEIVSGFHAKLVHQDGGTWYLEDLQSTNGTFLDGIRINGKQEILKPSTIRLGRSGPIVRVQLIQKTMTAKATTKNIITLNSLNNNSSITYPQNGQKAFKPFMLIAALTISIFIGNFLYIFPIKNNTVANRASVNNQSKAQAPTDDAALEISSQIHFFDDPLFQNISDETQYRKAIGDIARIQAAKMINGQLSRIYPTIIIGRQGFSGCNTPDSPGIYNPMCQEILVGFNAGIKYEYPIEVIYVIAHEYAHHLVKLSLGSTISGLDNELTADCFAGYMAGFWARHGKLTKEELLAGFEVMQFVAKKEPMNSKDSHGDPGQRQGAFMGGVSKAYYGTVNQEYQNFCLTLDRILTL